VISISKDIKIYYLIESMWSIQHKILFIKLDQSVIRGMPNNLIKSFLSERTQRVKIDDTLSE